MGSHGVSGWDPMGCKGGVPWGVTCEGGVPWGVRGVRSHRGLSSCCCWRCCCTPPSPASRSSSSARAAPPRAAPSSTPPVTRTERRQSAQAEERAPPKLWVHAPRVAARDADEHDVDRSLILPRCAQRGHTAHVALKALAFRVAGFGSRRRTCVQLLVGASTTMAPEHEHERRAAALACSRSATSTSSRRHAVAEGSLSSASGLMWFRCFLRTFVQPPHGAF